MKKNMRKGDKNPTYHYLAPDQSEITLLTRNTDADGGDMAYCSIPVGKTSVAVCHESIHEIWYFTAGVGQYWIKKGDQEDVYSVSKGSVVSLPKGTSFQFRNTSSEEALEVVIITMPPWPGEGEAIKVNGLWATPFQPDEPAAKVNDATVSASSTSAVANIGIFSGATRADVFIPRLVQKPEGYHYLAPDMSEIRLLTRNTDASGGDMAHCTLPPGQTSIAVKHKSIHELWYITAGEGDIWLKDGDVEEIHALQKGSYVSIPVGASFQFRTTSLEPLEIVITSMPPWPGADEAVVVNGKWPTPAIPSGLDTEEGSQSGFSL